MTPKELRQGHDDYQYPELVIAKYIAARMGLWTTGMLIPEFEEPNCLLFPLCLFMSSLRLWACDKRWGAVLAVARTMNHQFTPLVTRCRAIVETWKRRWGILGLVRLFWTWVPSPHLFSLSLLFFPSFFLSSLWAFCSFLLFLSSFIPAREMQVDKESVGNGRVDSPFLSPFPRLARLDAEPLDDGSHYTIV